MPCCRRVFNRMLYLTINSESVSVVEFRKCLALLTSILEALLCKIDIKRHSLSWQATRCQPAFSKPCLVNLISKDTHPVFSISRQASLCQALPGKLDIKRHSPGILYISTSLTMSTSVLKTLPGKLDIKRQSPSILYISASLTVSTSTP